MLGLTERESDMIQGRSVMLRTARLDERELVYSMALSTEYMKQCFAEDFADGFDSFEEEYSDAYFDDSEPSLRAGMMICLDDIPLGFVSYSQVSDYRGRDWIYHFGTMELDIWMDGEKNCGKGYGVDALTTLVHHLYKRFNINTFMICPERINPRAIHSYEKAGFQEVAADKKRDVLLNIFGKQGLSLLRPDDEYLSDDYCFMIKQF